MTSLSSLSTVLNCTVFDYDVQSSDDGAFFWSIILLLKELDHSIYFCLSKIE